MSKGRPNHRGIPLGEVVSASRGRIRLRLSAALNQGDGIKFEKSDDGFICNRIYKNGRLVSSANAGETIELDAKAKTSAGDSVVKTSDAKLNKALQIYEKRRVPVTGTLTAISGGPARLVLCDAAGHEAVAEGQQVQPSRTSPTTKEDIESSMSKLGDTPYQLVDIELHADEDIFIAKSALNALRRDAVDKLTRMRTSIPAIRVCDHTLPVVQYMEEDDKKKLHVLVRSAAQFEAVKDMATGDIYTENEQLYFDNKAQYPNLRLKTDRLAETPEPYQSERLLVTDHGGLHVYPNANDVTLDHSVYALNADALSAFVSFGAKRIALSPELDITQAAQMMAAYKAHNGQDAPVEAVLWARYELMAMRHCVLSGALGTSACGLCKKRRFFLKDLKGNAYPIVMDTHCQSHIYHSRIMDADANDYIALGVRHFRVELFNEDAAQSKTLVARFLRQIGG